MSEKLKSIIEKLNKALDIIEETADITNDAINDNEFDKSEEWRAYDIKAFCLSLRKSIRDNAVKHGYYYW